MWSKQLDSIERSSTSSSEETVSSIEEDGPETIINFLSFLANAQAQGISFLSIKWQAAQRAFGSGGTSIINEALANIRTTLAFKRVQPIEEFADEEHQKSDADIFRMLINEITVLGDSALREHPNIAQLQGICWDVSSDGKVWPVLISEKSQLGDLYKFAHLPVWRELDIKKRLKLCIDIQTAVLDMHSIHIIHGDLKPQNVLVFQDHDNSYTAKIIDFGYSGRYETLSDLIKMPISWPWNPPEHIRKNQKWNLHGTKKMDIFSLGMLCLWILFDQCFLNSKQILENFDFAERYQSACNTYELSMNILQEFKIRKKLSMAAQYLLENEDGLGTDQKFAIGRFLSSALEHDPNSRRVAYEGLLGNRTYSYARYPLPYLAFGTKNNKPLDKDFNIGTSIWEIYSCDFRVRLYIFKSLEERLRHMRARSFKNLASQGLKALHRKASEKIAFQLALCYKLGLGVTRDEAKSVEILQESRLNEINLENIFGQYNNNQFVRFRAPLVDNLIQQGHLSHMDFASHYQEEGCLESAELHLFQEIKDLRSCLGVENDITMFLRSELASVYDLQGHFEQADRLRAQLVEDSSSILGPEDPDTLTSILNRAVRLRVKGELKEAERMEKHVMETSSRILGSEHLGTLTAADHLASTYREAGELEKAEKIMVRVLEGKIKALGKDHRSTVVSIANLASIHRDQAHLQEAEKLDLEGIESLVRTLGANHVESLAVRSNLVATYNAQRRWKDAETVGIEVLTVQKSILGAEHLDTIITMHKLAVAYGNLGEWEKAEELESHVTRICSNSLDATHKFSLDSKKLLARAYCRQKRLNEAEQLQAAIIEAERISLGAEHPDTLNSRSYLSNIYWEQGRIEEAKELGTLVVEIKKKVLGPEHPDTFHSMTNLASMLWNFGDPRARTEAAKLDLQVIEIQKRVLGVDHPDLWGSMDHLAFSYSENGRWRDAERVARELIEMKNKVLGTEHPHTLHGMANLAVILHKDGRLNDAEELGMEVVRLRKMVLGEKHPNTLISMGDLAQVYWEQRHGRKAIELMENVVKLEKNGVPFDTYTDESEQILTEWKTAEKINEKIDT